MRFDALGLNDTLIDALGYMGFEEATPIQEGAIPQILNGRDIIACAQTGTGKTASPEQAQEVHAYIRQLIAKQDAKIAESIQLLYGGSVKAANAAERGKLFVVRLQQKREPRHAWRHGAG